MITLFVSNLVYRDKKRTLKKTAEIIQFYLSIYIIYHKTTSVHADHTFPIVYSSFLINIILNAVFLLAQEYCYVFVLLVLLE